MNFLHQKINSCFVIKESANLESEDFRNTIFSSIPFILGKYIFMNWWNVGEDLWMSFLGYYHILHVWPFFDNPAIGLKAKVWQFQIGNIPKNCIHWFCPIFTLIICKIANGITATSDSRWKHLSSGIKSWTVSDLFFRPGMAIIVLAALVFALALLFCWVLAFPFTPFRLLLLLLTLLLTFTT